MNKNMDFIKRLSNQNVYLINELRRTVMKSIPGLEIKFFAKQKGGDEYSIDLSSDLLNETLHKWKEITEKEFNEY
jgi:hypothetical protein